MQEILEFVKTEVPTNWHERDIKERLVYWSRPDASLTEPRRTICALEVWCEFYGRSRRDFSQATARRINIELSKLTDYHRSSSLDCGPYGRQRGFARQVLPRNWTRIASANT